MSDALFACPECAHEWNPEEEEGQDTFVVKNSNGNILQDGDLVDSDHDIDCKIDGFGAMGLKSEFVRKA